MRLNPLMMILTVLAAAAPVRAALYSINSFSPRVTSFDEDSFDLISGGTAQASTETDLSVDETGRLFGVTNRRLYEFDRDTGVAINDSGSSIAGGINGLAAHGGSLYVQGSDHQSRATRRPATRGLDRRHPRVPRF